MMVICYVSNHYLTPPLRLLYHRSIPSPLHPLSLNSNTHHLFHFSLFKPISNPLITFFNPRRTAFRNHLSTSSNSSDFNLQDDEEVVSVSVEDDLELEDEDEEEVDIEIIKLSKNSRRIICRISINANLETVWNLLTDYEKLADFIPGLAVCQLLEKSDNRARLFQIGQQNLAFGIKFNAKGIVDCYEKDLETIPFGHRRDIEFKMIEGDFQVFEGKWSIEEMDNETEEVIKSTTEQEFQTVLSYVVDVKPKLWLPVRLVEGRLCREIKVNLLSVKRQAQKVIQSELHSC